VKLTQLLMEFYKLVSCCLFWTMTDCKSKPYSSKNNRTQVINTRNLAD